MADVGICMEDAECVALWGAGSCCASIEVESNADGSDVSDLEKEMMEAIFGDAGMMVCLGPDDVASLATEDTYNDGTYIYSAYCAGAVAKGASMIVALGTLAMAQLY